MDYLECEIKKIPDSLRDLVTGRLFQWLVQLNELELNSINTEVFNAAVVKVWASSQFVAESCIRKPLLLIDLNDSGDLGRVYTCNDYKDKFARQKIDSESDLMRVLRHIRQREMIRIAWRDLAGWAKLPETLRELSWLADSCIQAALDFLYKEACEKRGTPLLSDGSPQQLIVLGMGKLGALELNFSSDIDLIFAYPEDGVLNDRKKTTYGEFFTRLCQSLVKVLDETTADGFVFRTDIRLRPYGDSGAIIMTFDGMENYYVSQAREWERYAMIKARQVAGDFTTGTQLLAMLNSFVYRRYLDYGAFEELRSLKAQIIAELKRKDRLENIKLGHGGIREIEFIGQAFQLIRGGSDKILQTRGILDVLQLLGDMKLLTKTDAGQLIQSYRFLRRVENHIQQYQDQQTHDLPKSALAQQALCFSLDYTDWDSFKTDLDTVRAQVQSVFDAVFSFSRENIKEQENQKLWQASTDKIELQQELSRIGFVNSEEILAILADFKQAASIRRLSNKYTEVLNRLMPLVIESMRKVNNPDDSLKRVLHLLKTVAGKSNYLSLLLENPNALAQLIRLSAASLWICNYLADFPILFDELIDAEALFEPLKKEHLDFELAIELNKIEVQDLEHIMICLRQFKQQNVLKVAATDIMGAIPLMVVSDYLTYIAESVVSQVVKRAWLILAEKHGVPPGCDNGFTVPAGFAVLAFGKFGGIELGYGSDLDLVFLYDCKDENALTDGEKPVSCAQFYGRLGLKVRHILDTRLLSGVLYDVDMRLRPNGDAGLLVTNINIYEDYLRNQAWTWEHQALVRSRFIAGDLQLKKQFETIRHRILCLPRDFETLKTEVREMREKMRNAHLSPISLMSNENETIRRLDLKQGIGGIADIEFIVQFEVLAYAQRHQSLTTFSDNVRLLEGLLACAIISETTANILKDAYCIYRDYGHKLVLQVQDALIDEMLLAHTKLLVEKIWREIME